MVLNTLYKESFKALQVHLNGHQGPLEVLRKEALAVFEKEGIPTTRHESWKYTNLQKVWSSLDAPCIDEKVLFPTFQLPTALQAWDGYLMVFMDGKLAPFYNHLPILPLPGFIGSLDQALHEKHPSILRHFGQLASHENDSITALNTAFNRDGALMVLPENYVLDKPVLMVFLTTSACNKELIHPRNLWIAESGAKAEIYELHTSLDGGHEALTNIVTELKLADHSSIEYYRCTHGNWNAYQINLLAAEVKRNASLGVHVINFGGEMIRNNFRIQLIDKQAHASLNGAFVLKDKDHVDNHVEIEHVSPETESHQLFKGLLGGQSNGVFNGKIFVHRDAQKINAFQSSKSMLLSRSATMNTKPQLEIYADDVKCSHGATVGQMDDKALFFLRARGIPEVMAKKMIYRAFIDEVIRQFPSMVFQDLLTELLDQFKLDETCV